MASRSRTAERHGGAEREAGRSKAAVRPARSARIQLQCPALRLGQRAECPRPRYRQVTRPTLFIRQQADDAREIVRLDEDVAIVHQQMSCRASPARENFERPHFAVRSVVRWSRPSRISQAREFALQTLDIGQRRVAGSATPKRISKSGYCCRACERIARKTADRGRGPASGSKRADGNRALNAAG